MEQFDAIILTVPNDFQRLKPLYYKLGENLECRNIIFIGPDKVGELVQEAHLGQKFQFLNEDSIIPFEKVNEIVKEVLGQETVPRNITGWYYQQFLKMGYSRVTNDNFYLAWDGDTIPVRQVRMIEDGTPCLDWKREYEENYFITMNQLFPGQNKVVDVSFISEHMLFHSETMKKMLTELEEMEHLQGKTFYERIMKAVGKDRLVNNSFSEFETYGTYVVLNSPRLYQLRRWTSYRNCGQYFSPSDITEEEMSWLAKDFDAISFEKGHTPEKGYEFFRNPKYQKKLSARQIVEIIQDEMLEDGYKESWD